MAEPFGFFVTGTDTGVGKTQVAAGLALALKRRFASVETTTGDKRDVLVWKPVQSGVRQGDPEADSYRLRMGSGTSQSEQQITLITLPEPLAPWMSALRAGQVIDFESLAEQGIALLDESTCVIVEGAGGLAVPLTERYLIADLARRLQLPLLLVARPGLGTVNHTVMSVRYAESFGLRVAGVVLNGCVPEEAREIEENVAMIETFSTAKVIGRLPRYPITAVTEAEWLEQRERWADIVESSIDWNLLG